MNRRFHRTAIAVLAASAFVLTGCASDDFAQDYAAGSDQGYVAGDGSMKVIAKDQRGAAIEFGGDTDTGEYLKSSDYSGDVMVVNFWYAACPPCRAEAPDLQKLNEEYESKNVHFVGVNVYDQAPTAKSFAAEFGVTYPSILDVDKAEVRLAFSDNVPPQAIPSTLVLDREGRVAAVIRGVADPSVLSTMIDDVLAE
ncbi:TlpA family protein disulfide reductase [Gulosibacter bifidus]|uniref:TlpA family protein disulfide reductase n=1 Tax=Gulosibacter bifidus TaxID=272239 RepID=A0ABW5RJS7_9MICO|nr:TlpA disulfide reductase family protein [Gulosibacter bifidus]